LRLPPAFWRLFVATASSNFGDGIGKTAFPLLAVTLTRDPIAVAVLTAAFFLPWLLLAIPAGVVVDRVDRTRAMALANIARAAVIAVLAAAVLAGMASLPWLYVGALALGTAEIVADSAYRAILPDVVEEQQLDRGNGYLQGAELVSDAFLGAPVASLAFAVLPGAPFVMSAGGFAVSAALVRSLPPSQPRRDPTANRSLRADMAEGIRWLVAQPVLRALALMAASMGLLGSAYSAVLVLYAIEQLGVPESLYGLLIVSLAVGGLLGSVTAGPLSERIGRGAVLRLSVGVYGLVFVALGLVRDPVVAALLLAVSSWTVLLWNVLTMSLRQQLIPSELFGRVQGAWRTLVYGSMPVGALLGGAIAAQFGLGAPFILAGVGALAMLVIGWRYLGTATGPRTA
jgi:MFS family permease